MPSMRSIEQFHVGYDIPMALFAKREAIVVSVVWVCSVRETGSDEKLSGRGVWQ